MLKNENDSNPHLFSIFKTPLFYNAKNKIDYAIISAMPEELAFFLEIFSGLNFASVRVAEFTFKIYDYQQSKVLIAHTGMGTAFAASVLTLIHSYFQPDYILVSGTAGAIKNGLALKDVIIVEKAFEAEIQDAFILLKNTPFESALTHPIKNERFPDQYTADPELLKACDNLKLNNAVVHRGTVVSSNTFPAPKTLFEKIKNFSPYSIDMETSAFYQTAWLLNAKVLAVRGISNILNPDGTDDKIHESDVKGSALAASKVLLSILNNMIFLKNKAQQTAMPQTKDEVQYLLDRYNFQSHPEGGYFAEIYKSSDQVYSVDPAKYNNEPRSAGSLIYYLLNKTNYSSWHSLKSDEIWHFYRGSPLYIYVIDHTGALHTNLLGDPLQAEGASFEVCIKAGNYFAAENVDKDCYSLVGCTVSPGFEYDDFKLASKQTLCDAYPAHRGIIERLSPTVDSKFKLASIKKK